MKKIYKECLFERGYLVNEGGAEPENTAEVLFSMAALFCIRITSGIQLLQRDMLRFVADRLGDDVPEPFYRGFPGSVRELSADMLAFDQFVHYTKTYGFGMFEEAGHSVFESCVERAAFREKVEFKELSVIPEEEAEEMTEGIVTNLLLGTRPLSERQYELVLEYMRDHEGFEIKRCASKNTAVRLLADSRDMRLVRFLSMQDVIRLTDEINYRCYGNEDITDLNLRNRDRKFIAAVMDRLFEAGRCDLRTCCEKKAVWCGLLHHIHYRPHCEEASRFTECMRGKGNISVYADVEKALAQDDVKKAALILKEEKGQAALLRSLNRLLSRCSSREEAEFVTGCIGTENVIVLLQLLLRLSGGRDRGARDFVFTAHNRMLVHHETPEETARRRSFVPDEYAALARGRIEEKVREALHGRLGRVWIDPAMKRIALPLQENTSQGGPGVLARGSRIPLGPGKKIRAFTYWEKVDDIDLSVIGLAEDGGVTEFSWRTMAGRQSEALTYSGDQTSGYNGGSEYYDVDVAKFKELYPDIRYLIFCDNVYTGINFSSCFCKAGYMLRDTDDSGEVFEPKTVQTSFLVDCNSTFAYLFCIDLKESEFVWLNAARHGSVTVAGTTSFDFLARYFSVTSTVNMYTFFGMLASEPADSPEDADVIVSDAPCAHREGVQVIRSCDFDKIIALMNE